MLCTFVAPLPSCVFLHWEAGDRDQDTCDSRVRNTSRLSRQPSCHMAELIRAKPLLNSNPCTPPDTRCPRVRHTMASTKFTWHLLILPHTLLGESAATTRIILSRFELPKSMHRTGVLALAYYLLPYMYPGRKPVLRI